MAHQVPRRPISVFRGAVRRAPRLLVALFAVTLTAACGDDDGNADDDTDDSTDDGTDDGSDAAPGADGSVARATGFVPNPAGTIHLVEGITSEGTDPYRRGAFLRDGPDLPPATLLASEGDCEIWTHPVEPPLCDPPCEDGLCVADGECAPFPAPVDAGEITVTGLLEPLRFVPGKLGYTAEPPLPADDQDLFGDTASIAATAPGADAPAFSLSASGVVPLVPDLDLEFDVTLVIEDGVDEVIRWEPESSGGVQLALQVGWHGAAYEALLVCEAEDEAGELVVPGSLISRFPDRVDPTGEAHYSWIARFSRDVAESEAGPIELLVAHRVLILQIEHR
jgi:hypothetical protein